MIYLYEVGAVRWRRATSGDPGSYRPNKGWDASAELLDRHPLAGRALPRSQWWIREEFKGDD